MLGGIWIGRHAFTNVDPGRYRRHVLDLLLVISALGMARAVFDIWLR
jgi:hypothetical protein